MALLDSDLNKFLISSDEWNMINELCRIFEVNLFYCLFKNSYLINNTISLIKLLYH